MNEKNQIKLFRDPLDPRELSFGFSQPHTEPSPTSGTGKPVEEMNNIEREWAGLGAGGTSEQNLDPKKLARANDPGTSKAAAKRVKEFIGNHNDRILMALTWQDGTFYQISLRSGLEPSAVWRRLNELERKGLIEPTGEERPGPTGRMCRVWRLK